MKIKKESIFNYYL